MFALTEITGRDCFEGDAAGSITGSGLLEQGRAISADSQLQRVDG
jgi:hypothetical protein